MWNPDRNVCINGYLIYHKSGTAENSGIMSPLNGSGQLNIHIFLFFFKGIPLFLFYLFIYLFLAVLGPRLCARAPPPVAASGGHSSSRCAGLLPSRPLLLRSTGSRRAGSAVVAHGPNCSTACGILPDQGSNPRPLHWQADSQPLCHQGSPIFIFLKYGINTSHYIQQSIPYGL